MKELLELCEFIDYDKEIEFKVKLWQYTVSFKGVVVTENNLNLAIEKMKEQLNKIIREEADFEEKQIKSGGF